MDVSERGHFQTTHQGQGQVPLVTSRRGLVSESVAQRHRRAAGWRVADTCPQTVTALLPAQQPGPPSTASSHCGPKVTSSPCTSLLCKVM